jgi:hypothetical protein
MGTASAPNAMGALGFAKETARLGMKHLNRYADYRNKHFNKHTGTRAFSTSTTGKASAEDGHNHSNSSGHSHGAHGDALSSATLFEPFISRRGTELLQAATEFINKEVLPLEHEMATYCYESKDKFTKIHPKVEELKTKV